MIDFHLEISQPDHNAMSAGRPVPDFLREKGNERHKVNIKGERKRLGEENWKITRDCCHPSQNLHLLETALCRRAENIFFFLWSESPRQSKS